MRARYWGFAVIGLFCVLPLAAQWFHYPTPGVPRLANGKPNLAAPAPKTAASEAVAPERRKADETGEQRLR